MCNCDVPFYFPWKYTDNAATITFVELSFRSDITVFFWNRIYFRQQNSRNLKMIQVWFFFKVKYNFLITKARSKWWHEKCGKWNRALESSWGPPKFMANSQRASDICYQILWNARTLDLWRLRKKILVKDVTNPLYYY